MRDSGVGRVLVASLHQAIGDVLPMRLGFYESWLHAEGLREGSIGLAPLYAVLSFLRQEGDPYQAVTAKAGTYAAEWTVESMSPTTRSMIGMLPRVIRRRVVLNRACALVRASYDGSRASWRIRKGTARVTITSSVFCSVREPVAHPLCQYLRGGRATDAAVVRNRGVGVCRFVQGRERFRLHDARAVHRACGEWRGASRMTRLVVAVGLIAAIVLAVRPAGAQPATGRILVMPFDNVSRDARMVWLGEASAVLLADDLNALGAPAITRDERREAFDKLQVPPAASLTDATVIRIGQLVRASQVVRGTLAMEGDVLVVRARAVVLDSAKVTSEVTERGALSDLFAMFERVARSIAPASSRSSADVERTHPPVAAFENYIKGLLATTPSTAVNYLEMALKADPAFDRARIALWEVYDDEDEHAKALASVSGVQSNAPLYRRARFRVAMSQLNLERYDDAFGTFKALLDQRSTPALLNDLGVVQLRRGGTPSTGAATYWFTKAADADATEPDYFFNLGYAYWFERDMPAAIYWLREALRRDPTDGDAHYVLGVALARAGNATESAREKELARRLSSAYEEWDKRPASDPVPRGLERLKSDVELPHDRQIEQTLSNNQSDQRELARFYLDRARRLVDQESDREALNELNRVLFLSPYDAQAHLLLGRIHLRAGHAREAIDALNISIWSADSADAHALLAQAYLDARESSLARLEAEKALAMDPSRADARKLLDQLR
ncbi:MAG: tetratricopeptide repeat protein [Vicinamibacterales bacterium]